MLLLCCFNPISSWLAPSSIRKSCRSWVADTRTALGSRLRCHATAFPESLCNVRMQVRTNTIKYNLLKDVYPSLPKSFCNRLVLQPSWSLFFRSSGPCSEISSQLREGERIKPIKCKCILDKLLAEDFAMFPAASRRGSPSFLSAFWLLVLSGILEAEYRNNMKSTMAWCQLWTF